jgi:aromatic ring-opening dioxygenase catalytic subunit (LigB family)
MATSHAFALMDPSTWEEFREKNRQGYQRRYDAVPPVAPQLAAETLDANEGRYAVVRAAHDRLAREIREMQPDVLLVVGDDQNEHFREESIPQIAIYNGGDFRTAPEAKAYTSATETANILLQLLVRQGFDASIAGRFANDRLISHAHVQVLERFVPERDIPVVPIFVNGIHVPALEPYRCHALGAALRKIIEAELPSGMRVAVIASGGLSHFTAGYPWPDYRGPFHYGEISVDFDRSLIAAMTRGEGASLASRLTSDELLHHGSIEFRCWLVALGLVGETPLELLAYEPFYRAIMGVGVGRWTLPAS